MLLLGFLIAYLLSVLILLLISPSAALFGALPFLVPLKFGGLVIVFLSAPIAVAAFLVALLVRADLANGKKVRWWWPIPASLLFLVAFFLVAEASSSVLMRIQAFNAKPQCLHLHSFFRSVQSLDSRNIEHGLYAKDGKIYLWSYKELRFLPTTYATVACLKQGAQGNQNTSTGGVASGASGQQGLTPHSTGLPAAAR
jgi:hypothetical protein